MVLTGIEDLREKREEINKQIKEEESEKTKIQQDLQILTKRLSQINDSLARKVRRDVPHPPTCAKLTPAGLAQIDTRVEYDKVIQVGI